MHHASRAQQHSQDSLITRQRCGRDGGCLPVRCCFCPAPLLVQPTRICDMSKTSKNLNQPPRANHIAALERQFGPIEYRPVAELAAYELSPRKHPERQLVSLAASIAEFGFAVPVLVDEAGTIIAGEAGRARRRRDPRCDHYRRYRPRRIHGVGHDDPCGRAHQAPRVRDRDRARLCRCCHSAVAGNDRRRARARLDRTGLLRDRRRTPRRR